MACPPQPRRIAGLAPLGFWLRRWARCALPTLVWGLGCRPIESTGSHPRAKAQRLFVVRAAFQRAADAGYDGIPGLGLSLRIVQIAAMDHLPRACAEIAPAVEDLTLVDARDGK